MDDGDRMLLWCEGGPAMVRAVTFPAPVEIECDTGIYVLVDGGTPDTWHYEFIDTGARA